MSDATDRLVALFEELGGESLRDVWLFDQWTHERLYVRPDVERRIEDLDVAAFVDNERYGYVTRDTYEKLYYADYQYTVRGFSSFELFRTFLESGDARIGVFASFDRRDEYYDFSKLDAKIGDLVGEYSTDEFRPSGGSDGSRSAEPGSRGGCDSD
ncbi:DUF7522 family protein [Halegenticoccus tardaugens]|uniref:DUF7522 family protein n=1 Tax=Halegenticoccus tardaugens TaxID=2071624 RepID=UPI001E453109|nr:hypothetical protein [Halegenticoccus tardaugens]